MRSEERKSERNVIDELNRKEDDSAMLEFQRESHEKSQYGLLKTFLSRSFGMLGNITGIHERSVEADRLFVKIKIYGSDKKFKFDILNYTWKDLNNRVKDETDYIVLTFKFTSEGEEHSYFIRDLKENKNYNKKIYRLTGFSIKKIFIILWT